MPPLHGRLLPLCLFGCLAAAQVTAPKIAFEVVSIKPGPSGTMRELARDGKLAANIDDAQATWHSIDLLSLVVTAFRLPREQILAPDWLADSRFEVTGKLPAGTSKNQVPEMLQAMLADRFRMMVHHEQKVRSAYLLVAGKGQPKLKPAAAVDSDRRGCSFESGGLWICRAVTMEGLARQLSTLAEIGAVRTGGASEIWPDRPVVDQTGIKGAFDFTMAFGPNVGGSGTRSGDGRAVTVYEALKALGLNFQSSQHPFDFVVVDHIERTPTEN